MRRLLAPLLALALSAPAFAADEPPRAQFEGKVDVHEVLLDVLVTDRSGNVIVGLGPNDFRVTEDGKPVELTGITFYSNRRFLGSKEEAGSQGIAAEVTPENRYFILFFDDMRKLSLDAPELLRQQISAGQKAEEWVDHLLANDWVAVASYDRKLAIQTDFTRDHERLKDAIRSAASGRDPETQWPSRIGDPRKGPTLFARLPRGNALRDATTTIYDGLSLLAKAAGPIVGRKNLLLFTIGFGEINAFRQYVPDVRYYPGMMQALNDNNVAAYTIDLTPAGTQHTLASAMNQLAADTGGTYLFNFTSFSTPLAKVSEENNGYYLLSYKTERPAGAKGYQKVRVKAANPEFKVKAREGYLYGET